MELDTLIINDISEINALILKIEEKVEWLKIQRSYKDRVIAFWKEVNWKFYQKTRCQFVKLWDMRIYLNWMLKWLTFKL